MSPDDADAEVGGDGGEADDDAGAGVSEEEDGVRDALGSCNPHEEEAVGASGHDHEGALGQDQVGGADLRGLEVEKDVAGTGREHPCPLVVGAEDDGDEGECHPRAGMEHDHLVALRLLARSRRLPRYERRRHG